VRKLFGFGGFLATVANAHDSLSFILGSGYPARAFSDSDLPIAVRVPSLSMYPFLFKRSHALFLATRILVSSLLIQSGVVLPLDLLVYLWATDCSSDSLLDLSFVSALHALESRDSSDRESLNFSDTAWDGSDAGSLSLPSHLTYVDFDSPSLCAAADWVMDSLLRNILRRPANESCPFSALTESPYLELLPSPGMPPTVLPSRSAEASPCILDSRPVFIPNRF
jgi:hypothetical protein